MDKIIDSHKHRLEKRAHIPSKEEAGSEVASDVVKKGKNKFVIPKNPITHRGEDPILFWKGKNGANDTELDLKVDIRSLYRHEHIAPERIIAGLIKTTKQTKKKKEEDPSLFGVNELFGNALEHDEIEKVSEYYKHQDGWSNRLIQGDSLLVMTSLLEREGMAGQVQTIYIDPPYGIKYGGNWQIRLNDKTVKDGNDEHISPEPEMIKAYRDTWEDGIHSYLSYMRDRLLVARELLKESGSCFVQISDENVHLIRNLMDEVFGSENFISQISMKRASVMFTSKYLKNNLFYLIWFAKDKNKVKYRQLFTNQPLEDFVESSGSHLWFEDIETKQEFKSTPEQRKEIENYLKQNSNLTPFATLGLNAQGIEKQDAFEFKGNNYYPPSGTQWKSSYRGLEKLVKLNRIILEGNNIRYKYYYADYPVTELGNYWSSIGAPSDKLYVVQTSDEIIKRALLMTTDPGDLILDPTCGSGTSAVVAEHFGRRWITIDTSRIALNLAKTRLLTSTFPYYHLYSDVEVSKDFKEGKILKKISQKSKEIQLNDIKQGFIYKEVPHVTLGSLANDEPTETEILYDQPESDSKRLRVAGPFTVETLQSQEPISSDALVEEANDPESSERFEERIFSMLKSAGIKNGDKNEQAVFTRIERLADAFLHAEGFYTSAKREMKAYFHIGPQFGTVSRRFVNQAIKECRARGDADWLVILGFSFESDIKSETLTTSVGSFEVTKVRMSDDLMQEGLLKKDKKAASFVTIGEPDIALIDTKGKMDSKQVEIRGLDIYDPIQDVVKARNVEDIAYWMVDEDYDGSNFVVSQVFFCGGEKKEFDKWKKGIGELAKQSTKAKTEFDLKIELNEEVFDRLYGFQSHPISVKKGQKIAVRVISQFGEEATKVLVV